MFEEAAEVGSIENGWMKGMGVHACNSNTWETEAEELL